MASIQPLTVMWAAIGFAIVCLIIGAAFLFKADRDRRQAERYMDQAEAHLDKVQDRVQP